jgi:outer membrane receptor protein involved in Fe transport
MAMIARHFNEVVAMIPPGRLRTATRRWRPRCAAAQLGLVVHNLADKQYWVPSRYFGGGQVTPAPRRSVAATASWQF